MIFEAIVFYTTLPNLKNLLGFFCVLEHVSQLIFSSTIWGVGHFEK
jgi:hypothetical protein